jgi:hypothetical protein
MPRKEELQKPSLKEKKKRKERKEKTWSPGLLRLRLSRYSDGRNDGADDEHLIEN